MRALLSRHDDRSPNAVERRRGLDPRIDSMRTHRAIYLCEFEDDLRFFQPHLRSSSRVLTRFGVKEIEFYSDKNSNGCIAPTRSRSGSAVPENCSILDCTGASRGSVAERVA